MNPTQNPINQPQGQPPIPPQPQAPQAPNMAGGPQAQQYTQAPQQQFAPPAGQAPQAGYPMQQQPQFAPAQDQSDFYATGKKPGITLGVLSIVFFWIPLAAWIMGGIAVSKGSLNPTLRTLGIIGIILGTIAAGFNLMLLMGVL